MRGAPSPHTYGLIGPDQGGCMCAAAVSDEAPHPGASLPCFLWELSLLDISVVRRPLAVFIRSTAFIREFPLTSLPCVNEAPLLSADTGRIAPTTMMARSDEPPPVQSHHAQVHAFVEENYHAVCIHGAPVRLAYSLRLQLPVSTDLV